MSTKTAGDWHAPDRFLPAEGDEVDAMDSGGHVQRLVYEKGLWWFPDRSMYVYYVPTFWRPGSDFATRLRSAMRGSVGDGSAHIDA